MGLENNMNIRARFEEIWPVPAGIEWNQVAGEYRVRIYYGAWGTICNERNIRLDTFTRCQETTDVYVSLVDELIESLADMVDSCNNLEYEGGWMDNSRSTAEDVLERAKQIMGMGK
jgi:hypothetical protein